MIKTYEYKDEVLNMLETTFAEFDLGDAIQINENYIYIELWISERQYKVRFRYAEEYNDLDELKTAILFHIVEMVAVGRLTDPRE